MYVVREIQDRQAVQKHRWQDFHKEPVQAVLSCYRYPQESIVKNPSVVSHLMLVDWEKNAWTDGFWAAVKSLKFATE